MSSQDIPPARGVNKLIGVCLLALALVFLLPIYGTLYYDGFASVPNWPPLFIGLACGGGALVLLGGWLLFARQRVGAQIEFTEGGFDVQVRRFFRRDISHSVTWKDIEEVKVIEAPRGGDIVTFRLSYEAAVARGVVQPTVRKNAPKALVRREIPFPIRLSSVSASTAVARFQTSATQAGAKLVETASFNVVVVARKVWSVEWP